jgi:transcriptional regulator with PAS, ATPase and Fis domain
VLPIVAETGIPKIGRIFEVEGERKIGCVYPLIKEGQVVGAVGRVVFSSFEEVERIKQEIDRLRREISYFKNKERDEHATLYAFDNILGQSSLIRDAVEIAKKISLINTDVLIIGESGTGKELFANSIHAFAHERKPFVRVNCPAIPFEIAESELFGYEKGAFSGALSTGKPGKFELAHDGTIFLDEIALLPLSIQAKLLRVIQEREVERLGSTRTRKLKFRLITATNRDLKSLVNEGKFRDDLYYRVAKAIIHVPPLRERRDDVAHYVHHYLKKVNSSFGTRVKGVSDPALRRLMDYNWPGNVRELINVLEQAVIKAWQSEVLLEKHLPRDLIPPKAGLPSNRTGTGGAKTLKEEIEAKEKELMGFALTCSSGDRTKASALLGMPRSTFYEKMKKYRIRTEVHTVPDGNE